MGARSGVNVVATGPIGARISGGVHLGDVQSPRVSPSRTPVRPEPAAGTVVEPAPGAPATEASTSPSQLVPVAEVVANIEHPPAPGPAPVLAPASTPRARSRKGLVIAAAVVALAAVATGVVVLTRGGSATHTPVHRAPAVAATIDLGTRGDHVAFGLGAIVVTEPASKQLARIDPSDNGVSSVASLANVPHSIVASSDTFWTSAADAPLLLRTSGATISSLTQAPPVSVGATLHEIVLGDTAVWGTGANGTLVRVDTATNQVVANVAVGPNIDSVEAGEGGVWVAHRQPSGTVTRVDPTTNTVVAAIPVGSNPDQLAVGAGAVWVVNSQSGTVSRIDPGTNKVVATITVGGNPQWVVVGLGAVWISDTGSNRVLRVDPATNTVTGSVTVGKSPESAVVGAGSLWVVNGGDNTVSRIDPGS